MATAVASVSSEDRLARNRQREGSLRASSWSGEGVAFGNAAPASLAGTLLMLQRSAGNAAVAQLVQRCPGCGGMCGCGSGGGEKHGEDVETDDREVSVRGGGAESQRVVHRQEEDEFSVGTGADLADG